MTLLHTLHLTLYSMHFNTSHFTVHFTLTPYTRRFTICTSHFTCHTVYFTPYILHSTLYTTLHFTCSVLIAPACSAEVTRWAAATGCNIYEVFLSMCFGFCTINTRVSIRVRGLHLFSQGGIPIFYEIYGLLWQFSERK